MGLEVIIEKEAREHMESLGGVLIKWEAPGHKGVPDRIAGHPEITQFYMEFKAPGKKLEPHQRDMCTKLARMGFRIYVGVDWKGVNSIRMAKEIIDDEVNQVHYKNRRWQPL